MNWSRAIAWPYRYLFLAPRGWSIKLTRRSHLRFAAEVAGKSVAVVGNAESLFGAGLGSDIDAADVIIRLNKGVIREKASQGSSTTMVGLTPELSEAEVAEKFDPDWYLMLVPKMRHYKFFDAQRVAQTLFYPMRYWLGDRARIGRRPSSGFMAISWLMRTGTAKSITLYGFDFGQTQTFYNPKGYKTPHDYDAEARIVMAWAGDGKLEIKRA